MAWEPLPLDIAEWMGMDDDHLRLATTQSRLEDPPERVGGPGRHLVAALRRGRRALIG
jgi:hypothetical protein